MVRYGRLVACATILLAHFAPVGAQTARSNDDTARVQQLLQQAVREKSALQAENERLTNELDTLKKSVGAAEASLQAAETRATRAQASVNRLSQASEGSAGELERTRNQMNELVSRYRETGTTLRQVEQERGVLAGENAAMKRELTRCTENNAALAALAEDALQAYERKGFWASLSAAEPFTQIKRTEIENRVDDERQRAERLRIDTRAPAAGPPTQ